MEKENKNAIVKNKCHSRMSLSGIPTTANKQGGDPQTLRGARPSGMTNKNKSHADENQHLQRLSWSLRNSVRGRFQIKFGMTPLFNKVAFTLIELLVVVLIIAVLAAIALPQYQKAVEKSRAMEGISLPQTLAQAEEVYYLTHNTYAKSNDLFRLEFPLPSSFTTDSRWAKNHEALSDGTWSIQWSTKSDYCEWISIGRLTGPYTNYGFQMILKNQKADATCFADPGLYCEERIDNVTTPFKGTAGRFCEKVMGYSYLDKKGGVRWYK